MIKFSQNKHNPWLKWIVFGVAVIVVAYCMPREDKNRYVYEENRPWAYSLLTAPFDIPVHLDSVSAQIVKDSIDSSFEPVYRRDVNGEKTMVSTYARRLEEAKEINLTPGERNRLITGIKKLYEGGIVDPTTYASIKAGKLKSVRMLHDNVAISIPTVNYMTARGAYASLDSSFRDPRFHNAIAATKLSELLQPNILLDSAETVRLRNELYQRAMAPIGVIQQGERIIDRGDIVTAQLYTVLRTYEQLLSERGNGVTDSSSYSAIGRILYLLLLFGALYAFLYFFRRDYFSNTNVICFLMLTVVGFILFSLGMAATFSSGLYLAPFTIVPVLVLVFLDSRTAFFTHTLTVIGCAVIAAFPFEFLFMQWVAGVTAIASIKELSKRSQLIRAAVLVFLAYSFSYMAVELLQTGSIERMSTRMFGYFGINSVFISFAYILVFIIEKIFGFTSRVTLVELSDINHPLLRELSEECPGTFQHSMAVSNLASAAAHRIGAKVQLVRAGALYHDIGKISNPAFFTENQHGVNPHDALDPRQSAKVVIGHVSDGLKRAEKAKLPALVRNFIAEHHGKGKAKFFYNTWCNAHPNEEVDESSFTYPGPNPTSRESSIVMMADSVEAASRSLQEHTPEAISALVNRIIDGQIAEGLHNDSPISFRDVNDIKETFISRLRTMYHARIKYPDLAKPMPPTTESGQPTTDKPTEKP